MENKTAVEWLKNKIIEDVRLDDLISGYYSKDQYKLFLLDKLDYALELEKQQIIDAHLAGQNSAEEVDGETEIQYYSQTYKKPTE
jgi:hypothetical protein